MRGVANQPILVIFVVVVLMLGLTFVVRQVFEPVYEVYGEKQANILARSLAAEIATLSIQEEGEIRRDLRGEWTIQNTEDGIQVSHGEFTSNVVPLLISLPPQTLDNAGNISIRTTAGVLTIEKV